MLTASAATEYSFEGQPTDAVEAAGSVFTAALVAGLRTGAADADHDGDISVDDAYRYVFDQVQAAGAAQTPKRWLYGGEGDILLARNPAGRRVTPAPLPESLGAGLDSPHPNIRIGAVSELGEWLTGTDPVRVPLPAITSRKSLRTTSPASRPSPVVSSRLTCRARPHRPQEGGQRGGVQSGRAPVGHGQRRQDGAAVELTLASTSPPALPTGYVHRHE